MKCHLWKSNVTFAHEFGWNYDTCPSFAWLCSPYLNGVTQIIYDDFFFLQKHYLSNILILLWNNFLHIETFFIQIHNKTVRFKSCVILYISNSLLKNNANFIISHLKLAILYLFIFIICVGFIYFIFISLILRCNELIQGQIRFDLLVGLLFILNVVWLYEEYEGKFKGIYEQMPHLDLPKVPKLNLLNLISFFFHNNVENRAFIHDAALYNEICMEPSILFS